MWSQGASIHLMSKAHFNGLWAHTLRYGSIPPPEVACGFDSVNFVQTFSLVGHSYQFNHLTGEQRCNEVQVSVPSVLRQQPSNVLHAPLQVQSSFNRKDDDACL